MSKILANQIANYGDDNPIEIKEGLTIPAGKPIQAAGVAGTSGQVLSSTGTTIQWVDTFDGDYGSLSNKPSIPAAQVNSDWDATSGISVILNKPVVPSQPSVTTTVAGSAALSYNSTNGEFTYTPPNLSSFLTSLGDAAGVTTAKISNWDTAYGWGNHASAGYLTSYTENDPVFVASPAYGITTANINNWTTAYGWGDHSTQGYLTSAFLSSASLEDIGDVSLPSPNAGQFLKWDGTNWIAAGGVGGGVGIALSDLSVTTAAAGTAALSYSNISGIFTYTPPDLSGYAQTTNLTTANWDTAYGWGDHSVAGYLSGYGAVSNHTDVNITGATNGDLLQYDGSNWTQFTPTYISSYSETSTLDDVAGRGSSTTNTLTVGGLEVLKTNAAANLQLKTTSNSFNSFTFDSDRSADTQFAIIDGRWDGNIVNRIQFVTGSDGVNKDDGFMAFHTRESGQNLAERLRIGTLGQIGIAGANYGTSGQVLTSQGPSAAPQWTTVSGGGGGANVTISDTIPAGTPSAGDLWWESDTGRLKVYYTDVDSSQWVDTSPPLADPSSLSQTTTNGTNGITITSNTSGANANAIEFKTDNGTTSANRWRFVPNGHLLPTSNADYDIGSAEYKVRHLFLSDNTVYFEGSFLKVAQHDAGGAAQSASYLIPLSKLKDALNASADYEAFKTAILAITDA